MSGLMELGPMTEDITVMGSKLTIQPITTGQLIALFKAFPVLIELMGGGSSQDAVSIAGPVAIAHVIATATGDADNPQAIERAQQISVGKTAEIIDRIIAITFEDGTDSFMERIRRATKDTKTLMNGDSAPASSASWSASLTGDAPKKTRLPLRHAN